MTDVGLAGWLTFETDTASQHDERATAPGQILIWRASGEPSLSPETLAALPIDEQVRLVRQLRLLSEHGLALGNPYIRSHSRAFKTKPSAV